MITKIIFISLGFSFSLFYGISSFRIFTYPHTDDIYTSNNLKKFNVTKRARFHEAWTHFACSALGWFCLFILYSDLFGTGIDHINIQKISAIHFLFLVVGMLGIIGFMPRTLWNLSESFLELTKKITK